MATKRMIPLRSSSTSAAFATIVLASSVAWAGPIEPIVEVTEISPVDPFDPTAIVAKNLDGTTPLIGSAPISLPPTKEPESPAAPTAKVVAVSVKQPDLLSKAADWIGQFLDNQDEGSNNAPKLAETAEGDRNAVLKISLDFDARDRATSEPDLQEDIVAEVQPVPAKFIPEPPTTRPINIAKPAENEADEAKSQEIARRVETLFNFDNDSVDQVTSSVPGTEIPIPKIEPRQRAQLARLPAQSESLKLDAEIAEPTVYSNTLALGLNAILGKQKPASARCLTKSFEGAKICIEFIPWAKPVSQAFDVRSILYQGNKAIVRYGPGGAEYFYSVFDAGRFDQIKNHLVETFGRAETANVPMAMIGNPTARNQVLRWTRKVRGSRQILELRATDDLRDIMPDSRYGVVRLYMEDTTPIFADLEWTDFLLQTVRSGDG